MGTNDRVGVYRAYEADARYIRDKPNNPEGQNYDKQEDNWVTPRIIEPLGLMDDK